MDLRVVRVFQLDCLGLASGTGRDRVPRGAVDGDRMRLPWFMPLSDEERKALKPPIFLAHCALAAVVIVRFGLIR